MEGLTNHPSQPEWVPGAGGLILHTIVPHPTDPARMWVAISAAGVFETATAAPPGRPATGASAPTSTRRRYPEFGQCVHKLVLAADGGERLYQQNHCGVYRSADGGAAWDEITAGLPSHFGFVMAAHPRDPQTVWTIPLTEPKAGRMMPDGAPAVWRTNDGGATWIRSGEGLPQEDAYVGVLREAMAVDRLDPVGVYFGTSTGQLYGSADEGVPGRARRQPAADLVRGDARRWLRPAGRPSSTCRVRCSPCSRVPSGGPRPAARPCPRSSRIWTAAAGDREPGPRRRAGSAPTSTSSWTASGPPSRPPCRPAPRYT